MRKVLVFIFVLSSASLFSAYSQTPQTPEMKSTRSAKDRILISADTPKITMKFGKDFRYVGGQTFILYNVARAEQHFYVDADKEGNVSRLYWVQFEGYLPENTHTYDYSKSQAKLAIGGFEFYGDAWARKIDPRQSRPDSDGTKAMEFLKAKGYKLRSDEVIMQRLVHMTDALNRNELMVIYLEDLSGTGMTAADLTPKGKDAGKWKEISDGLLARTKQNMKLSR